MKKGYLYDTHVHTNGSSACGQLTPAETVKLFHEAGYTGIVITEHFVGGNTCIDRSLPWNEWVEAFCKSYEKAKEEGDKVGLQVFFGWESGYQGTEFLIYGLDKQWLLDHPEIRDCSIERQYELVHGDGGIVIHAHPFRKEAYIKEIRLFPHHVDAVEGINASHSSVAGKSHKKPQWNDQAMAYAREHGLPVTSGSDQHTPVLIGGGMIFSRRMASIHDLMAAIMNGEAMELLDGTKPVH